MGYEILEESGETRRIGIVKQGDYAIEVRTTRPEFLLEHHTKPFYFYALKRSHKKDGGYDYVNWGTGIAHLNELRHLAGSVLAKNSNASTDIIIRLLKKLDTEIGEFKEPNFYFELVEDKVHKERRKALDVMYEHAPGKSWMDKNKYILQSIASSENLPLELLPILPDYSKRNRKLTIEEIDDDMENRRLMMMTAPVELMPIVSADAFDELAPLLKKLKEKTNPST